MIQQERGTGSAIDSIVLAQAHVVLPLNFRRIDVLAPRALAGASMAPKVHMVEPRGSRPLPRWRQTT